MCAADSEWQNSRAVVSTQSPRKTRKQVKLDSMHFWFFSLFFFFPNTSSNCFYSGGLWSRLGPSHKDDKEDDKAPSRASSSRGIRRRDDEESDGVDGDEEDDTQLQKMWGAMIKQKEQQTSKMKKSRLDNLPSLQIEISQDSSNGSDSDSWLTPPVGSVGIGGMMNAVEECWRTSVIDWARGPWHVYLNIPTLPLILPVYRLCRYFLYSSLQETALKALFGTREGR